MNYVMHVMNFILSVDFMNIMYVEQLVKYLVIISRCILVREINSSCFLRYIMVDSIPYVSQYTSLIILRLIL